MKITNEVAIDILKTFRQAMDTPITAHRDILLGSIDMGIKALEEQRPQGEREFIEILAEYREDDYDTLPEYRGKPYYSIHYRENGEEFDGYGTYNIEVLSRYLQDYFFNPNMESDDE